MRWIFMFVNAYFALTLVNVDPGIALLNLGIVIFMAAGIYFYEEPKDGDENHD
jgi:hypothetical protein